MQIVEYKDMDDCFDGSFMKSAVLSEPMTRDCIVQLGQFGELQFYESFSRPFYRLDIAGKMIVKGIQDETRIRIILNRDDVDANLASFEEIIARLRNTAPQPAV